SRRTRCSGKGEQPSRRGGQFCNLLNCGQNGCQRGLHGLNVLDHAHCSRHALHIDAGRIRCNLGQESVALVRYLQLYFTPTQPDLGVHPEAACKLLSRSDGSLCRLPIDIENPGKREQDARMLLQRHGEFVLRSTSTVADATPPGRIQPDQAPFLPTGWVATYGLTIFLGSTIESNSASVTNPSFNAAARNVRSLSDA